MVKLETHINFLFFGGIDKDVFADGVVTVVRVSRIVHTKHVDILFVSVVAVNERCFCAYVLRKIMLKVECSSGVAPMHSSHVVFHYHIVASTEKHYVDNSVFVRFCGNFGVNIVEINGIVFPFFCGFEKNLKICATCGKEKRSLIFNNRTVEREFRRQKTD